MTLEEFLKTKTNAHELCVICDNGWIYATFWIDSEDLFTKYLDYDLSSKPIRRVYWDYLPIVNENNACIKIPCHYVDI
jgi:hypothetical protein